METIHLHGIVVVIGIDMIFPVSLAHLVLLFQIPSHHLPRRPVPPPGEAVVDFPAVVVAVVAGKNHGFKRR